MKNLVVLFALLFVAAFQANAQTTYSCLEVIDGEHTGNTVDITITRSPSDAVTYTRTVRPTSGDDYASYNLTSDPSQEVGNDVQITFSSNAWFIPFDGGDALSIPSGTTITDVCICKATKSTLGCSTVRNGYIISCVSDGCSECYQQAIAFPSDNQNSGIFLNATSVTAL